MRKRAGHVRVEHWCRQDTYQKQSRRGLVHEVPERGPLRTAATLAHLQHPVFATSPQLHHVFMLRLGSNFHIRLRVIPRGHGARSCRKGVTINRFHLKAKLLNPSIFYVVCSHLHVLHVVHASMLKTMRSYPSRSGCAKHSRNHTA